MKTCQINNCNQRVYVKRYCRKHYLKRQYRIKHNLPFDNISLEKHYSGYSIIGGYNKKEKNVNWNGGISEYPNHYQMKKNRLLKLNQQHYICEKCGKSGKYVHHIDKSKDNHAISNLIVLCSKCHAKLHKGGWGRSRIHPEYFYKISKKTGIAIRTIKKYLDNKESVRLSIRKILLSEMTPYERGD